MVRVQSRPSNWFWVTSLFHRKYLQKMAFFSYLLERKEKKKKKVKYIYIYIFKDLAFFYLRSKGTYYQKGRFYKTEFLSLSLCACLLMIGCGLWPPRHMRLNPRQLGWVWMSVPSFVFFFVISLPLSVNLSQKWKGWGIDHEMTPVLGPYNNSVQIWLLDCFEDRLKSV